MALAFHAAVQEGNAAVQWCEAYGGQDAGVGDAVDVADEGIAGVLGWAALATVELELVGKFRVDDFPGGSAESPLGAH
ncbi:hypothetical protein GCM10009665_39840 [Kitasatospora nipponensis]|uniref:Uncharacterized protein n=1 Tax=Kitasatospora nipponensis TaxID=258049 RepID=A0ABN1WIH0_9ACTN